MWCGKKVSEANENHVFVHIGNRTIAFDSLEHKKQASHFLNTLRKNSRPLAISGLLALIIGFSAMYLLSRSLGGFILFFLVGFTAIKYPYIVPPIALILNMKNTVAASKLVGVLSFLVGLLFFIGFL